MAVDDAFPFGGFEVGAAEVAGSGLESVEEESGLLLGDGAVGDCLTDAHDSDLDRVRIFEKRNLELFRFRIETCSFVEVAEPPLFHGGRSAADAVGLNVLAARCDVEMLCVRQISPLGVNLWNQWFRSQESLEIPEIPE